MDEVGHQPGSAQVIGGEHDYQPPGGLQQVPPRGVCSSLLLGEVDRSVVFDNDSRPPPPHVGTGQPLAVLNDVGVALGPWNARQHEVGTGE
jgi:hypothetical protein